MGVKKSLKYSGWLSVGENSGGRVCLEEVWEERMPRLDLAILGKNGIVMILTTSGSLSFICSFSSSIWAIDPHLEDSSEVFKKH